jgi:hypothetical protein
MDIIILTTWAIWNNQKMLSSSRTKDPAFFTLRSILKEELKWIKLRATRKTYNNFSSWIDSFI